MLAARLIFHFPLAALAGETALHWTLQPTSIKLRLCHAGFARGFAGQAPDGELQAADGELQRAIYAAAAARPIVQGLKLSREQCPTPELAATSERI